jgi:hypothetical protein
MSFQFYSNMISQTSRRLAGGIFVTGLAMISFGLLIYVMPKFFATIAAFFFFIIGFGTCGTAIKMFIAQRQIDKTIHKSEEYRENVKIRIEHHDENL